MRTKQRTTAVLPIVLLRRKTRPNWELILTPFVGQCVTLYFLLQELPLHGPNRVILSIPVLEIIISPFCLYQDALESHAPFIP